MRNKVIECIEVEQNSHRVPKDCRHLLCNLDFPTVPTVNRIGVSCGLEIEVKYHLYVPSLRSFAHLCHVRSPVSRALNLVEFAVLVEFFNTKQTLSVED